MLFAQMSVGDRLQDGSFMTMIMRFSEQLPSKEEIYGVVMSDERTLVETIYTDRTAAVISQIAGAISMLCSLFLICFLIK